MLYTNREIVSLFGIFETWEIFGKKLQFSQNPSIFWFDVWFDFERIPIFSQISKILNSLFISKLPKTFVF